jgi:hypothetical protein
VAALASGSSGSSLRYLRLSFCEQYTLGDEAFAALAASSLTRLDMDAMWQPAVTDRAFVALSKSTTLRTLNLSGCDQPTVTSAALAALGDTARLTALDASHCFLLAGSLNSARYTVSHDAAERERRSLAQVWRDALLALARCRTLRILNLSRNEQLRQADASDALLALTACVALEELELDAPCLAAQMSVLRQLCEQVPALRELRLQPAPGAMVMRVERDRLLQQLFDALPAINSARTALRRSAMRATVR